MTTTQERLPKIEFPVGVTRTVQIAKGEWGEFTKNIDGQAKVSRIYTAYDDNRTLSIFFATEYLHDTLQKNNVTRDCVVSIGLIQTPNNRKVWQVSVIQPGVPHAMRAANATSNGGGQPGFATQPGTPAGSSQGSTSAAYTSRPAASLDQVSGTMRWSLREAKSLCDKLQIGDAGVVQGIAATLYIQAFKSGCFATSALAKDDGVQAAVQTKWDESQAPWNQPSPGQTTVSAYPQTPTPPPQQAAFQPQTSPPPQQAAFQPQTSPLQQQAAYSQYPAPPGIPNQPPQTPANPEWLTRVNNAEPSY